MSIYVDPKFTITPQTTLAVHCLSSAHSELALKTAREPEREFTAAVLRSLSFRMEAAKIDKFDDGFYHALLNPLDSYDILSTAPEDLSIDVLIKRTVPSPASTTTIIEYAGFRLVRTSGVKTAFLMGKTSSFLHVVPVWLMAEKDFPQPEPVAA